METRVMRELVISDEAAKAVEYSFNPSGNARAGEIKLLAAALITQIDAALAEVKEGIKGEMLHPQAEAAKAVLVSRRAAVAKTKAEEAAMWGVKAVHA